jgi:hypothetical protein
LALAVAACLVAPACGGGGGTADTDHPSRSPVATLITGQPEGSSSPGLPLIPSASLSPAGEEPVVIDTPKEDARITSPVVVSGMARDPNGEVSIFVRDKDYHSLGEFFHVKISCGKDCMGSFSTSLPFHVKKAVRGQISILVVVSDNGGNRQTYSRYVEVTFLP